MKVTHLWPYRLKRFLAAHKQRRAWMRHPVGDDVVRAFVERPITAQDLSQFLHEVRSIHEEQDQ